MCLLVVLFRVVPDVPLIVAANRDEMYDRPAEPAGLLREAPHTVGSRDLVAGGTALAVSEAGVVAGLTNKPSGGVRDPSKLSRGQIPLALTEEGTARAGTASFGERFDPGAFNPCWVLAGDRDRLLYLDLTSDDRVEPRSLEPGVHVLENRPLDAPSAKVDRVKELVGDPAGPALVDRLRTVLADHAEPGDSPVSAACVHTEMYGTRSAMLARVPEDRSRPPEVLASDGPSCVNPLVSVPLS